MPRSLRFCPRGDAAGEIIVLGRFDRTAGLLDGELERMRRPDLRGNVRGPADNLKRFAVRIENRIIARLDPNFLAALGDKLVLAFVVLASPEFVRCCRTGLIQL